MVSAQQVLTPAQGRRAPSASAPWGLISTIALLAILTVLPALGSSFWVDEAKTWNVVREGFRAMPGRLWWNNEQSPLFFAFECASSRLFGPHEWSLRLPSTLFVAAACFLLFRIAVRWLDRDGALLAVIAFLANPAVAYAAADARVYAMALCAVAASTLALIRWMERGRAIDGALYAAACASIVYAHLLWTPAILAQGAFCLLASRSFRAWKLPLAWAAAAALCLPLAPAIRAAQNARSQMSFPHPAPLSALFDAIVPTGVIGPLICAIAVAALLRLRPEFSPAANRIPLLAVFALSALPPAALYAVFLVSDVNPFLPRYYLASAIALAVLTAWAIAATRPAAAARIQIGFLIAFSLMTQGVVVRSHAHQDWRGAMAQVRAVTAARPDLPVLLVSGFEESNFPEYLDSPLRRQMIFAPALVYPGGGREFYLPRTFGDLARETLEGAAPAIEQSGGFLLVALDPAGYQPYLLGRFRPIGLRVRERYAFEGISLTWFDGSRNASATSVAPISAAATIP